MVIRLKSEPDSRPLISKKLLLLPLPLLLLGFYSFFATTRELQSVKQFFSVDFKALPTIRVEDQWWIRRNQPNGTNYTHPHMGARHPNGSLGMVVDPSVMRLLQPGLPMPTNNSSPSILCPAAGSTFGIEGEGGNPVLYKIRRGLQKAQLELKSKNTEGQDETPARILCMIYTVHTEADQHSGQAAIAKTWGRDCDGLIGASNLTDHSIGAIDLPHEGPEEYGNMWAKIRTMWTYAYENYINDYDYFFIAGDDVYMLVDHLRHYVKSEQVKKLQNGHLDRVSIKYAAVANETATMRPRPLLMAQPMLFRNKPVIAGGGGYVLNQAALDMWGKRGADTFRTGWVDPREDIFMADFFIENHVYLSDSQDDKGGWLFHGTAQTTSEFNGRNSPIIPQQLQRRFNFSNNIGIDDISEHQISFHLKDCKRRLAPMNLTTNDLMFRYHAFFKSWCANDNVEAPLEARTR